MTPPGATVAQTAMALYRNNQDAFVQGDINRMRQGVVLQIPTSAELFALDAARAETEFRSALAGKRVAAKPLTDVTAAAPEDESRLKIASAAKPGGWQTGREPGPSGQGVQPNGDIEQELLLVRETGESTRQETDELRARVRQLEASLTDIRDLLALRNAELDPCGVHPNRRPLDRCLGGVFRACPARDSRPHPPRASLWWAAPRKDWRGPPDRRSRPKQRRASTTPVVVRCLG